MKASEALERARRIIETGDRRDLTFALCDATPTGETGTFADSLTAFEKANGPITNWRVGRSGLTKILALEAFDRAVEAS